VTDAQPTQPLTDELSRVVLRHEGLTLKQRLTLLPISAWASRPSGWELKRPKTLIDSHRLCTELRFNLYTMLEVRRGRTLMALGREIEHDRVPGAIVDCGVWNGGSSMLMSSGAPTREVWMFDSFEGMPEPTEADGKRAEDWVGECHGGIDKVRQGFARYCGNRQPHLVKGWFDDTVEKTAPEIGPIALLHIDADWYESMHLALKTFYPLVSPGGYIAVDDYGVWPGVKLAVDELRREFGDSAPLIDNHFWQKPR
jgi:O-methyltransferase